RMPRPMRGGRASACLPRQTALATEFLVLGIDPYPRKPEASFGEQVFGTGESGPFAALAKLKYGDGEEK
ncbi:MAG: hypothetical protein NTV56_01375, partial [Alphaproteobacteria bacterium]|nr:hypothetical protein [Alphaproteobacteria bacterium]